MKNEYAQTYQQTTTNPDAPLALKAPGGEDWQLHSWQHGPTNGWMTVVWQREQHRNAMSDIYSHSEGRAPAAGQPVKTIEDMPEPK